ncbi:MAG TPA: hypothetical protein VMS78_10790 [Rhizomicrobium sp.]|nr:hypothetical protein [Rhizomicrobium sp.]
MWWALTIMAWTLLSFVASPLIGSALSDGKLLEVRKDRFATPAAESHTQRHLA